MAVVTKTRTYGTNDTLTASYYNADRDEIIAGVNSIVNAQIAVSAAIDYSKLNLTGLVRDADIKSDAAIAVSKIATGLTGSLVGTTDTQTLSSKTLTKPIINGSVSAFTTDSDASTVTFDMAASNVHTVVLAGNRTLAVSNVSVGQPFILRLVQDSTGSRVPTWFTTIKWVGGVAPALTTTANKIDTFGFICTSTDNYDGYVIGQNL